MAKGALAASFNVKESGVGGSQQPFRVVGIGWETGDAAARLESYGFALAAQVYRGFNPGQDLRGLLYRLIPAVIGQDR